MTRADNKAISGVMSALHVHEEGHLTIAKHFAKGLNAQQAWTHKSATGATQEEAINNLQNAVNNDRAQMAVNLKAKEDDYEDQTWAETV